MVIHRWNGNFSTSDSSLLNFTNISLLDSSVPQHPPGLSRTGHTVVAVFLGVILILGVLNNLLVLLIFAKFQSLRTPINLILLNISVSDMLVCIFGTPFSFAASLHGRWLIGHQGCKWYGFANALFGIVSLVSLSILSYERYATVVRSTKADHSDYRKAWLCVGGSWLYSLLWTLPPILGWSSYGPEGVGTSCSVQWRHRSPGSVSYVVCLFVFCLLLPLLLMVFCYSRILVAVRGVAKINLMSAQKRENRILAMVVSMVTCYLLCWMPYGVVALWSTFGRMGLVNPIASIVPSILAKSSTVFNPIIYMLLNKQFYRCFVAFVRCQADPLSSHVFNTQLSSRVEDNPPTNGLHLRPLKPGTLPDRRALSSRAPAGSRTQREQRSLILVVHYTP